MTTKQIIKNLLPYGIIKKMHLDNGNKRIQLGNPPKVFSQDGHLMKWIYLQDSACVHHPYSLSAARFPSYIMWDRFNWTLPYHMYTYENIYKTVGVPRKKFAMFTEGKEIMPQFYKNLMKKLPYLKEFDAIFTDQDFLLDRLSNAYYVPNCSPWYASEFGGGYIDEYKYQKKNKLVSIVSSNKEMCELHIFRKKLAIKYEKTSEEFIDCFGTYNGGLHVKCADYLEEYMYHIAIENQISNGYFTEKITNCFLSMTVPIYIGAVDIAKYFNIDGIIYIKEPSFEAIEKALKICRKEDYEARKEAIIDNFHRVQKYLLKEDYMYNEYTKLFDL